MKAPRQFETPRLLLAAPTPADADAVFQRYASDPDVTRYLGWPRHHSLADTRAFLAFSAAEWERWPAGPYLIRALSDGQLLGSSGLAFQQPDEAMTGYVLAKDAWGKGYATEALNAVVDVARRIGVVRVYALCHPQHQESWRVLEKCGFTRDESWVEQAEFPNLAPGVLQDVVCYQRIFKATADHALVTPPQEQQVALPREFWLSSSQTWRSTSSWLQRSCGCFGNCRATSER